MFRFKKFADYSDGSTRVKRFDTMTGEPYLVDPADNQAKPWPLLGVGLDGEPPTLDRIPMDYVAKAVAEGWAEWTNHRVEHKSGGPKDDPWFVTHTFHHADRIIFNVLLLAGEKKNDWDPEGWVKKSIVYDVVSQPDKYEDANEPGGARVDWTYQLELVSVNG